MKVLLALETVGIQLTDESGNRMVTCLIAERHSVNRENVCHLNAVQQLDIYDQKYGRPFGYRTPAPLTGCFR